MPLSDLGNYRKEQFNKEFYKVHIKDAINCQNQVIKTGIIFFIFDSWGFNYEQQIAIHALEELIEKNGLEIMANELFVYKK